MGWEFENDRPIYLQIASFIERDILKGKYKVGDKLPSVREFASVADVNPNTMQKAFSELEKNNIVFSSRTSGRFVTDDEEIIQRRRVLLAEEYVDDFLIKMKEIGFDEKEITLIMEESMKGEENE
ncbi:GntR family transcriptional regulator [Anaerofustis stercorihominis]|uniref:GntR family transcriptional regulator n=1 Tax=Anaerofustis stercorihominis TaxID=214853 RepID=UPI00110711B2|nr:GntR family transcriptional regulator [Anaerofustis stercorihominis]